MNKYIRKPVAVEAFQWKGDVNDFPDERDFIICSKGHVSYHPITGLPIRQEDVAWISTPHGMQRIYCGDWVIRDADGDWSVCKDHFDALYEPVL